MHYNQEELKSLDSEGRCVITKHKLNIEENNHDKKIQHLILISDENITFDSISNNEENVVDEHVLHMRKLLKTNLDDMDLSVRAYKCLKAAKISTLSELVIYDTHELLKFRNFGKKSLVEIEELLVEKGLTFGMDISKYKIDEE